MLYYLFTIDGDWQEYHSNKKPDWKKFEAFLKEEFDFCNKHLDNKFIHLIHSSPLIRTEMFDEPILQYWQNIPDNAGLGLHIHEEIPNKETFYNDEVHIEKIISIISELIQKNKLTVPVFRGGFLAYKNFFTPLLEKHGFIFDVSGAPGRYRTFNNKILSDWLNAPFFPYVLNYENYKIPGDSEITEIPIGSMNSEESLLFLERISDTQLEKTLLYLSGLNYNHNKIISSITHTYCFPPKMYELFLNPLENIQPKYAVTYKLWQIFSKMYTFPIIKNIFTKKVYKIFADKLKNDILKKINIMKKYGKFVSLKECKQLLITDN